MNDMKKIESGLREILGSFGKISLATKDVIVISNFNTYLLNDVQNFLEKYGYKLEGGNIIDQIVVFKGSNN